MIAHLATFTFRDSVTAAEVDQFADDLRAMAGALQLELPPEWLGWSDG